MCLFCLPNNDECRAHHIEYHIHLVPIVNLDCSGTSENVWNQLLAIGRLMRPAAHLGNNMEVLEGNVPNMFDDDDENNDEIEEAETR